MLFFSLCCFVAAAVLDTAISPRRRAGGRPARKKTPKARAEQPLEIVLDLAASLLDAGLPLVRVLEVLGTHIAPCAPLRTVARCLEMNMGWQEAWREVPGWLEPLGRALRFTEISGARSAHLLRNSARLHRRERVKAAEEIGAQFGTKLVLPLGLCALPAFIAMGVIPLIVALLPNW